MYTDIAKTKAYYQSITEASLCNCAYCRSYRVQVRSAYPQIAEYLAAMGIDIEKPFETSPLEPDESGLLTYCGCQYIVFGSCDANYRHKIGDVEFRIAPSHPRTDIVQAHFVLELYPIRLNFLKEVSS